MRIIKVKNYEEMSLVAADIVSSVVIENPNAVLGLATGSTPIGLYKELVNKYKKGIIDFENVKSINLDEYYGIDKEDENSYSYFMNEYLFKYINIKKENIYIPNGMNEDEKEECSNYNQIIDNNEIDIQVLGLGHNGHIGFNEPNIFFNKRTNLVNLSLETINANKRFFIEKEVPSKAYTMGICDIMRAKKILLLVSGVDKANILKDVLCKEINPLIPGTILRLHHNLIIVADEESLNSF